MAQVAAIYIIKESYARANEAEHVEDKYNSRFAGNESERDRKGG